MLNAKQDNSDVIFMHPDLMPEDKDMVKNMFLTNKTMHEKSRSKSYMGEIEDKQFLKTVDYAIKAVLQHNINKRLKVGGSNG